MRESLQERGRLLQNAPGLVRPLPFILPVYSGWERLFYGAGLKLYDRLAGSRGIEPSRLLSRDEVIEAIPTIRPERLRGGIRYLDAQFDDARMAIALARKLFELGGVAVNHFEVRGLLRKGGRVAGVRGVDGETGREFEVSARGVINATGGLCDVVRRWDRAASPRLVTHSQGAHLVLDRSFLPGVTALMVPKTRDGRVLFAIPWKDHVVVGTTDVPVDAERLDPQPLQEEVEFILAHAGEYLVRAPGRGDILSCFAGIRPLLARGGGATSGLSREHALVVSDSGLVTIAGGKWTTYRSMAAATVDEAARVAGLPPRPCGTGQLALASLESAGQNRSEPGGRLHPRLDLWEGEVVRGAREEMARGVEDVLARRSRALFLDARAAVEVAPQVARILARELGRSEAWASDQVQAFSALAAGWRPRCVAPLG